MKKLLPSQLLHKTIVYFPLLVVILGVIITLTSFWQVRTYNLERLQQKFEIDAFYISSTIESTLREHMIELEALRGFFASDKIVDRGEFTAFTLQALSTRPGIRAFEWIPRVSYEERDAYERLDRGDQFYLFKITERDSKGQLLNASARRYYYPVEYVEPLAGNERAIGYDLGSDAIRLQALQKAAETGLTTGTAPIRLVQEPGNQSGFLVFKPVYAKNAAVSTTEARNTALRGFVLGVFRSGEMVQGAFSAKSPQNIAIKMFDVTQTGAEQLFFDNDADSNAKMESSTSSWIERLLSATRVSTEDSVAFAGRSWRIQIETTPLYVEANLAQTHWIVLPTGGALTLLVFLIIRFLNSEILERKRVEKALLLSEQGLQLSNVELATALQNLGNTQAQLVHQEKLAGIGQLAAGVAHEINNPLGFIVSNIETLEKYVVIFTEMIKQYREFKPLLINSDDPAIKEKVAQITLLEKTKKIDYIYCDLFDLFREVEEGLQRVHRIVVGLRLFSRTDQSRQFEGYNLNEGIKTTLIVANNEIKYSAVIEKSLQQLPSIEAVGGEINQVLLNLFVNAAQAIREKDKDNLGIIKVSTRFDQTHVFCEIEDNGIGIPAEKQKDIYNPFYTTKPIGQGTGLGLSISYDIIVNRHFGEINVESSPGKGTTFLLKLPIKHDQADT
ncbi:MAG: CHASE domain-containing protein [Negativicutes bacterium]|nr:CHASE domain-containing protein [Negativicutes bacterium]